MKKILFLYSTALSPPNGENIKGNHLLKLLSKEKVLVDVICPHSNPPVQSNNIKYYFIKKANRFNKNKELNYFKSWISALKYYFVLKKDYDIIYNFGISSSLLAYLMKNKKNYLIADLYEADLPELRSSNNFRIKILLKLLKIWLPTFIKKADKVVMLTRQLQNYLKQNYNKESIVIYDAADKELFKPTKSSFSKKIKFIFHGGIEERDGLLNFLKAILLLKPQKFKFIIAGKGNAKKSLENFVIKNNLQDKIKFLGWVDYKKMPHLLNNSDIGVVIPKHIKLNDIVIPRKIFEYISLNKPILVTDSPAIREILTEKEAFFCSKLNPISLSKKIKEIMHFPNKLKEKTEILKQKDKLSLQDECKKLLPLLLK